MLDDIRTAFREDIEDHRAENTSYSIEDILTISLLASICGLTEYDEFSDFADERRETLAPLLPSDKNGDLRVPHARTFERVWEALDPRGFSAAFGRITAGIEAGVSKVLACDGKTCRALGAKEGGSPLHMVSAWGCEAGLVLGQVAVGDKTNEIPALRELLSVIDLDGRVVVADAMHTQRETCALISKRGGDWILPVKGNQKTLQEDVVRFFADHADASSDTSETVDSGHGRIDIRRATAIPWTGRLAHHGWPGLAAVGRIERERVFQGRTERETAYFIMSRPFSAEELNRFVRAEWGVENGLHRTLDVLFRDDAILARTGNAPKNLAVLRRLALNVVAAKTKSGDRRMSKRRRMRLALMTPSKLLDLFA